MKAWEEILQRLRNRELPEEVRRDYRSASQFAKALRMYVDELPRETEEKREVRRQEEEKLEESKAELKRIRAEEKGSHANKKMRAWWNLNP